MMLFSGLHWAQRWFDINFGEIVGKIVGNSGASCEIL